MDDPTHAAAPADRRAAMPAPPPSRLLPALLLGAVLLAGLLGVWLFPHFQAWVNRQDCVALGRTDCGG